ncbi:MAG: hypothetical protein AAGD38_03955 [Acidobacteriota bacterium]
MATDKNRDDSLQQAFDQLSPEAGFDLEPGDQTRQRMVGAAVVLTDVPQLVSVEQPDETTAPHDDDDKAIKALIEQWESADPAKMPSLAESTMTDPVLVIAAGWIGQVDPSDFEKAIASDDFAEQQKEYPFTTPRSVTLTDWTIFYTSAIHAVATYHYRETYANDQTFGANSVAIVLKEKSGTWKIAAFSKHTRFLDFHPVEEYT